MSSAVYCQRKSQGSALWKCIKDHFYDFVDNYNKNHEKTYGYFRPIIEAVVDKFLDCGNLQKGFARIKRPDCKHEYLLSFSCRGRWFCPCCHQKKVLLFGEFMINTVTYPLPHRQYVFSIPIMLRTYFKYNRKLLTELCHVAQESLLEFMRIVLSKPDDELGMAMAIQTFGEYLNFHPHLHAVVADGLFMKSGMFHVLPKGDIKQLEEIFRNKVIKLLLDEGLLAKEMGAKLLEWKNSGFSVYKGPVIKRGDKQGLEKVCQYIIRNTFNEQKMMYNEESGTVIYRSKKHFNTKRNFEVFKAIDFIANLTQHIPEKSFQLVRYYGWYSNKKRGMHKQQKIKNEENNNSIPTGIDIIDISDHTSKKVKKYGK